MVRKRHYYLCNVKHPKEHCKTNCFCGVPHLPDGSNEEKCTKNEYCKISKQIVKCVKMTEKDLRKWKVKEVES
jgi:hypothetical protein